MKEKIIAECLAFKELQERSSTTYIYLASKNCKDARRRRRSMRGTRTATRHRRSARRVYNGSSG